MTSTATPACSKGERWKIKVIILILISFLGIFVLFIQNVEIKTNGIRKRGLQQIPYNPNLMQQNMQQPGIAINPTLQLQSPFMYPMNNMNPNMVAANPNYNNMNPNMVTNPNYNMNPNFNFVQQPLPNPFVYQVYNPNPYIPHQQAPYAMQYNPMNTGNTAGGSMATTSSQSKLPLPLISEITEPFQESDIPYFWHIPKVGGSTMKNIFSSCYNLKRPNRNPSIKEDSLEVIGGYVNVDTATEEGIAKAKQLGLIPARVADIIISPRIYEVQTLFNQFQRPRMFTMIRHPFHRLFSFYNYHKHATWEKKHSSFEFMKNMTFVEYLGTKTVENNWLTCTLTNTNKKLLNETHVQLATDILARKCLIGLTDHFNTSVYRFQQYFNWQIDDTRQGCLKRLVFDSPVNKLSNVLQQRDVEHKVETLEEGDDAWNLLLETNKWDLMLYQNAQKIFEDQARYFPNLG